MEFPIFRYCPWSVKTRPHRTRSLPLDIFSPCAVKLSKETKLVNKICVCVSARFMHKTGFACLHKCKGKILHCVPRLRRKCQSSLLPHRGATWTRMRFWCGRVFNDCSEAVAMQKKTRIHRAPWPAGPHALPPPTSLQPLADLSNISVFPKIFVFFLNTEYSKMTNDFPISGMYNVIANMFEKNPNTEEKLLKIWSQQWFALRATRAFASVNAACNPCFSWLGWACGASLTTTAITMTAGMIRKPMNLSEKISALSVHSPSADFTFFQLCKLCLGPHVHFFKLEWHQHLFKAYTTQATIWDTWKHAPTKVRFYWLPDEGVSPIVCDIRRKYFLGASFLQRNKRDPL